MNDWIERSAAIQAVEDAVRDHELNNSVDVEDLAIELINELPSRGQ